MGVTTYSDAAPAHISANTSAHMDEISPKHYAAPTSQISLIKKLNPIHQSQDQSQTNLDEEIKIAGTMLPDFFHPEEKGAYNYFYEMIMKGLTVKTDLIYLPAKRAQKSFADRDTDCFFIASKKPDGANNPNPGEARVVHSDIIHDSAKKIYTLKGQPVYRSTANITRKKFAADQGAGSDRRLYEAFSKQNTFLRTESIERSIELLRAGRVDAIIAYEIDMVTYLHQHKDVQDIETDDDFGFQTAGSSIACWESPKTTRFLDQVNGKLKTLKTNGMLSLDQYFKN
ncbi:transporter substrate-binding domain-containing protein [Kordiimonas sp. SCSIO 12610]|uniref:transporter substrate-binding domain-containing protein n=1 Tax=Kordiimonas sp. SCSIO 12610 TaxID=2829597 RepID=UPI00210B3ED3|nr:transporter substrate-binding domain-containing protein [Kordiimonas sp. SCSIO 12610]UTW56132.1 transporter substrate-binding domain-containing protein [Kordiimonas sp. SCSIO 12610]